EHFVRGEEDEGAAVGLAEVFDDSLAGRGEEAVGVIGLGEVFLDVEGRLLPVVDGGAELDGFSAHDAKAGGDICDGGVCFFSGMGVPPMSVFGYNNHGRDAGAIFA